MGLLRVLAGQKHNVLERGTVTVSSSNALYPPSWLWDGRPSNDCRFAAAGLNDHITVDTCLTQDPGFESWLDFTTPEKWTPTTTGGAAVERAPVPAPDSGTYACKLSSPAINPGNAQVEQVREARAGETLYALARARTDFPPGEFIHLYCQNQKTKRWLQPGAVWAASELPFLSQALGSTYQTLAAPIVVEGMDVCLTDLVPLRFIAKYEGQAYDGGVLIDNFQVLPAIDLASIHGHNLDASIAVELRSTNDPAWATSTLRATLATRVPAFYGLLGSPVWTDRYWRVLFAGTNLAPIEIGECVLGLSRALTRRPNYGHELKDLYPDVATETPAGELYVAPLSRWPRRVWASQFRFDSEASAQEQLREVYRRCQGRRFPLVVVPDDAKPEVLLGRIDRSWKARRVLLNVYDATDLIVTESPFAVATP